MQAVSVAVRQRPLSFTSSAGGVDLIRSRLPLTAAAATASGAGVAVTWTVIRPLPAAPGNRAMKREVLPDTRWAPVAHWDLPVTRAT